jgi:hypothetical protein
MSSPESARDNVVSPLRRLGLIEEDGALTPRGNKWRVDASYAEACDEILAEVYPEELTLLTGDDGKPDLSRIKVWFDHKGFGDSNARQMAATYAMIAGRDVPEAPQPEAKKPPAKKAAARPSTRATKSVAEPSHDGAGEENPPKQPEPAHRPQRGTTGPNVHLDIQIHIPADASLEQIDQIFASMAKHLYGQ